MLGSSLVNYFSETENQNGRLYWNRVDRDGLPFRGNPELIREEEFEERVVRVPDYNNGFFDTSKPKENRRFNEIMERCVNQWYHLVFIERFWQGSTMHYIEWVEFYLQDGTKAKAPLMPSMEAHGGRQ